MADSCIRTSELRWPVLEQGERTDFRGHLECRNVSELAAADSLRNFGRGRVGAGCAVLADEREWGFGLEGGERPNDRAVEAPPG